MDINNFKEALTMMVDEAIEGGVDKDKIAEALDDKATEVEEIIESEEASVAQAAEPKTIGEFSDGCAEPPVEVEIVGPNATRTLDDYVKHMEEGPWPTATPVKISETPLDEKPASAAVE